MGNSCQRRRERWCDAYNSDAFGLAHGTRVMIHPIHHRCEATYSLARPKKLLLFLFFNTSHFLLSNVFFSFTNTFLYLSPSSIWLFSILPSLIAENVIRAAKSYLPGGEAISATLTPTDSIGQSTTKLLESDAKSGRSMTSFCHLFLL
jgi:hypothetical protein